jgi:hypothetical protein
MAITWTPKQFELARAEELALSSRLASSRPWIVSGLVLGVPVSGLDVEVSNGQAYIAGYVVDVDSEDVTVADDATSTVYLGLVVDINNNVTGATLATTAHVSGYYVTLGTVTAASGDITGVATTGRSPITQVDADLVASVFTRTGAVVAEAGDYDADQIDYDNATSGLVATDVQEAIDELAARPAAGGWTDFYIKTSDQSFSSGTTRATVTDLVAPLQANSSYYFECRLYLNGESVSGVRIGATVPSGATGSINGNYVDNYTTNIIADYGAKRGIAFNTDIDTTSIQYNGGMQIMAGIVTTSSTSGDLTIQAARQTTSGTLTVNSYSILKIKKI